MVFQFLKWVAVVTLVLFTWAAVELFRITDPLYLRAPSDAALRLSLQRHRLAIEELRNMAILYHDTDLDDGRYVSADRRRRYERLLSDTGVTWVYANTQTRSTSCEVRFNVASGGGPFVVNPEWDKGLLYLCHATDDSYGFTVKPSLDDLAALPYGEYMRPLEPHWFVMFNYQDG